MIIIMSTSKYNIKLENIQKQKKRVLDDIMMIENMLKSINDKIQMIDNENKKITQMNILTDKNLKKEYTNKLLSKLQKRRIGNLKVRENELKNRQVQCSGMNIVNDHLKRCTNISNKKYCDTHEERYHYEKPEDCPVCMDTISEETEIPLMCGHWIHKKCLIPTNIHICPVCRQKMQQDEVNYIFGAHHQERNIYAQNYEIPFDPQQIIIQNNAGIFLRNLNQINNPLSEEEALELYIPNSPFINTTLHVMSGILLDINLRVNLNDFTYFNNRYSYVRPEWSSVPQILVNKVNTIREILIRRCFPRANMNEIINEINTLPEHHPFVNKLFLFLYNISLNDELYSNDYIMSLILKIVKNTLLRFGVVRRN
jgi:hypothetical protein